MRLGFVGMGTMAVPMAGCLIHAGHQLTVYDVRSHATTVLCDRATSLEVQPPGPGGSEMAFTSLPGPTEVEHAALDPASGIIAGLLQGAGYIDMTTNSPAVALRVAEACRARGMDMLDAPVSGRLPAMTVMVGGDEAVFARYRPLLAAMAGNIFMLVGQVPAASPSSSPSISATRISLRH